MEKFNVYPKEGEMFTLEFTRFDFDGRHFTLYDSTEAPSKDGYLSPTNVAAILPVVPAEPPEGFSNVRTFHVHLKNKEAPFAVTAHTFDVEQKAGVKFYWETIDSKTDDTLRREVSGIYVALSEVVAIIPAGGLWRR